MRKIYLVVVALFVLGCGESDTDSEPGTVTDEVVEFLNLRVISVAPTRAVVAFETSIPTSCEIEYGISENALSLIAVDPDMAEGEVQIDHEVPLEDLQPDTTYFWRGFVETAAGSEFRSEIQTLTTSSEENSNNVELANHSLEASVMSVSSNFGGGDNVSTWGIMNAFDGQMTTEWATNGDGDDAAVEISFPAERSITHFAFRSRKMTDGTSIIEQVQLRFDGGDAVGPFDTPDPDERYVFELSTPVNATTVTVEALQTTGGNTGAKEIEFLGPN